MANGQNLELALKIKALVEGAKNVQALADDVQTLQGQAGKQLPDPTPQLREGIQKTSGMVNDLVKQMAGLLTLGVIKNFVSNSITEFNRAEAAYRGLEAVANRSGIGIGRATQEASKLAADGQLSLQAAQKSLQNLLSRGYNLDEATKTITALKNTAVSGRAAHLSMSEAVITATEGLKNENSILVDNAGVTKNVSVMWKEYAASIGKTVGELTQHDKVMAENIGIQQEAAAFMNQSADAADSLQGKMNKASNEAENLQAGIGQELVPAMTLLLEVGSGVMQYFVIPFIKGIKIIGAAVGAVAVDIGNLFDAVVNWNFSDWQEKGRKNAELFKQTVDEIINAEIKPKSTPKPPTGRAGGATALPATPSTSAADAKKAADEARRIALAELDLKTSLAAQAVRLEQDDLERQIAANRAAFDAKLIDAREYYTALSEFQRQQAASEIRMLQLQRASAQAAGNHGGILDQVRAQAEIARIDADIELVQRRVTDQQVANARARVQANIDAVNSAEALIDAINQEAFVLGLSDDERARALALLDLEKLKATLTAEAYDKLSAALNNALDGREAAAARKKALDDAKQQADDIYKALTENLQKSIADVLNNGFNGDGARGAVLTFVNFIKTSLSNVLAAELTQGVLNLFPKDSVTAVGGFLGLGGKRDGSNPANAVYVQDVANAAKLVGSGSTGGMAVGLFSGLAEILGSLVNGLKAGLVSLVQGIGGLFGGGGGGGQNWIGAIASAFGYADGGYTGAGSKYQPAGTVHKGEFVFSQAAVNRLGVPALSILHRLASGLSAPTMPRWGYADGGAVNLPGSSAPPTINNSTRIINHVNLDDAMSDYLKTRSGERAILNIIQRNPNSVPG